jgi:hypothetical protein
MNDLICDLRFGICDLERLRIGRFIHRAGTAPQFARRKTASRLSPSEHLQIEN